MRKSNKLRVVKIAALAVALIAVMVLCFASCGSSAVSKVTYKDSTLKKATYNVGETFNPDGAKIVVTYEDGKEVTVDVTADMVVNAKLTNAGEANVEVIYTENDKTVVCKIPVTVNANNELLNARKDAVKAVEDAASGALTAPENAAVLSGATDAGVRKLVDEAKAAIQDAENTAAVTAAKNGFETGLSEYIQAKKAAVETINAKDYSVLVEQFKLQADNAKADALNNVKSAVTAELATAYAQTYTSNINNLVSVQEVYRGKTQEEDKGLNPRKLVLLDKVEKAIDLSKNNGAIIEKNKDNYDAGTPEFGMLAEYANVYSSNLLNLSTYRNAVLLALSLDELAPFPDVPDPAGDIFEALNKGLKITPAKYVNGTIASATKETLFVLGEGNVYTKAELTNDATGALLIEMFNNSLSLDGKTLYDFGKVAAYEKLFGNTDGLTAYKYVDAEGNVQTVDLVALLNAVKGAYEALTQIQTDALTAVGLIDDIETAAAEAKDAAIEAAWTEVKDWGTTDVVLSLDTTITDKLDNLVFDKTYKADLVSVDAYRKDGAFTAYNFDKQYVIDYFVPNLVELGDATANADVNEIKDLVAGLSEIIYSPTVEELDSDSEIVAAEQAVIAFKANYGEEKYVELCYENGEDVLGAAIANARQVYNQRVTDANELVALIKTMGAIESEAVTVNASDYLEGTTLYNAYAKYLAFASANTLTKDKGSYLAGFICLDAITQGIDNPFVANAEATFDVNGTPQTYTAYVFTPNMGDAFSAEERLALTMKEYCKLAFKEAQKVAGNLTIYAKASEIVNQWSPDTDTEIRAAITNLANVMVADLNEQVYVNAFMKGEVKTVAADDNLTADSLYFNFINVLNYNKTQINAYAAAYADAIGTCVGEGVTAAFVDAITASVDDGTFWED